MTIGGPFFASLVRLREFQITPLSFLSSPRATPHPPVMLRNIALKVLLQSATPPQVVSLAESLYDGSRPAFNQGRE